MAIRITNWVSNIKFANEIYFNDLNDTINNLCTIINKGHA